MTSVLITGSSKGIGYEAALILARAGYEVVATMRTPANCDLDAVATDAGLPIRVMAMDVDDDASVAAVFGDVGDSVDILVNNAGILRINALADESLADVRGVMETNYFGSVRCIEAVLPAMRKRGTGTIINVTSISGRIAFAGCGAYCASKFALEAYSESLAQEVSCLGIKVALVEPGIIDTPMTTSETPQYTPGTEYLHGRRMHIIFDNPNKPEAPPALVGEMIRYVIESDDARLRFPVGPDAHAFIGWRAALSDEDWIELGGTSQKDYFDRVFIDTGIDLRGAN